MSKKKKNKTKKKLSVDELISLTSTLKRNLGPVSKARKLNDGLEHKPALYGTIAVSEDKLLDAVKNQRRNSPRRRKVDIIDRDNDLHDDWGSETDSCISALSLVQSTQSLNTSNSFINPLSNGSISSRQYYFSGMPGPPKSIVGEYDGGHDGDMSVGSMSASSAMTSNSAAQLYGRTLRELVTDIEDRAKKNLPTPNYIASLNDMPASMFSWKGHSHFAEMLPTSAYSAMALSASDGKIGKNIQDLPPLHSKPVIDIIPCHQPIELVLAKANDRSRKQILVSLNKENQDTSHAKRIQTLINLKSDKVEEFKRLASLKLLQTNWVKIIFLNGYMANLYESYRKKILRKRMNLLYMNSSNVMTKFIKYWREKRNENRYGMFFRMMSSNNWRMSMQMRILHKRYNLKRITQFLTLCKGQKQIATVVHRFIKNVKLCQKYSRAFIISKRARLEVLVNLFDKLERSYIRSILNRKKNQSKNGAVVSQGTMEILKLDPQLK